MREPSWWRVRYARQKMNLILKIHDAVTGGARHMRHQLFHRADDLQREWADGEVFLRCQRCGLRSHGVQIGPPRLMTQLAGYSARHRVKTPA
jgi:hypothetical protein